jgi:hypothetical protein
MFGRKFVVRHKAHRRAEVSLPHSSERWRVLTLLVDGETEVPGVNRHVSFCV